MAVDLEKWERKWKDIPRKLYHATTYPKWLKIKEDGQISPFLSLTEVNGEWVEEEAVWLTPDKEFADFFVYFKCWSEGEYPGIILVINGDCVRKYTKLETRLMKVPDLETREIVATKAVRIECIEDVEVVRGIREELYGGRSVEELARLGIEVKEYELTEESG